MTDEVVPHEAPQEHLQLGELRLANPAAVVGKATEIASALANVIDAQNLYTVISGKKYVRVEGWSTLGAMLGVLPREVDVFENEDGTFEATVELIRASNQAVIGRASAICGSDEKQWAKRIRNARRSMAITRATGKAYRLGFSWIIQLAGYQPTPAEEMVAAINGESREVKPQAQKPKRKPRQKPKAEPEPAELRPFPAYLDQIEKDPELEAMELGAFWEWLVKELTFDHRKHAFAAIGGDLGRDDWQKHLHRAQVMEAARRHQEEKDG